MSNFAALIDVLTVAGSRLSDGTANASGTVWLFEPGSSTEANAYSDAAATTLITQPITLTNGGTINRSDYPSGIYVTSPVRLLVQDADQNTVVDTVYIPATAGDVGVDNDGFTDSTLDAVLTKALTSFGGTDWKYKESAGATERTAKAKWVEPGISVKDFGAVGDGVAIDTTAIQSAMNRAKALSCAVLFPAGTYKIDQALTLTSATGVSLIGAGTSSSKIITSHATANIFTLSSCSGFSIQGLGLSAAATNSGSAISISGGGTIVLSSLLVSTFGGGTFLIPLAFSTSCTIVRIDACNFTAKSADATARAIKLADTTIVTITGGGVGGDTGAAIELTGGTSFVGIFGVRFSNSSANIGVLFNAAFTGTDITVAGCPTLRSAAAAFATPFDMSGLATDVRFRQWGNEVDGTTIDVASAGTATPNRARGNFIRIRATSTGAAITIAAPTPVPTTTMYGVTLVLDIYNEAGGAISNPYTMNAAYHLTTVPNQTNLNHNVYLLEWDPNSSVWRQISLSVTT